MNDQLSRVRYRNTMMLNGKSYFRINLYQDCEYRFEDFSEDPIAAFLQSELKSLETVPPKKILLVEISSSHYLTVGYPIDENGQQIRNYCYMQGLLANGERIINIMKNYNFDTACFDNVFIYKPEIEMD